MSAQLFFDPQSRPLSNAGVTLPAATWTFFLTATTTPADVYSDAGLAVSLGHIVTADSDGRFDPFYMDGSITYRAQLHDADGVLILDVDPYYPPRDYQPGTVVWWFGAAPDLETHYPSALWQICDGTNGSPNLAGRAPMGVGAGFAVGDEAGDDSVNIDTSDESAHTHTAPGAGAHALTEAELPVVTLNVRGNYVSGGYDGGGNQFYRARPSDSYVESTDLIQSFGSGDAHEHPGGGTTSAGTPHHHTATVATRGPMTAIYALMRRYP